MVTKDRRALTEQTIRTLYENADGVPFSLLVVDDCSGQKNFLALVALESRYGFSLIANSHPSPLGASKNWALTAIKERADEPNPLVYLTDNDVYFAPGWLGKLLAAWEGRPTDVKLLGGGCHRWLGTNRIVNGTGVDYHYKDAISGWSWLLELATWQEYGPFDANALGSGQSEDWAFCQRIKVGGYEVASIWPEVVIHCGRTNTEGRPATGAETIVNVPGVLVE